jgi:citrate synthase
MSAPSTAAKKGLEGVVATTTGISHVDGQAGQLIIGGYPLEEIAGKATFEEVAYLLWKAGLGKQPSLPTQAEYEALTGELRELRTIPDAAIMLLQAARNAPSMDALRMAAGILSINDSAVNDESVEANLNRAKRLTAQIPVIVAAHDRFRRGLNPVPPKPELNRAANFLYMLNDRVPAPEVAHALDTYWTTVIDHGMNASTFTARVIASTKSDMYSAVTGAIGALKGPLHGGAPGPVLDMLLEIKTIDRAESWVREELAAGKRIMGFGHRVYKVRDPRANVLKAAVEELGKSANIDRELTTLATGVEKIVLRVLDEVKPGRQLNTNVEFYTALVLQSIGLTPDQFSSLFAAGRIAGWTAHVLEQQSENRLIRPASEYRGPTDLKFVPREQRG